MKTNSDVEKFPKKKKHFLDAEVRKAGKIILSANKRVEETIKWSSPTFMCKGSIASLFMNTRQFETPMLKKGGLTDDFSGSLEGERKKARFARFYDMKDMGKNKAAMTKVKKAWIKLQDTK